MMRKLALIALVTLFAMPSAALAQTDIDDIQVYDGTGAPASPFDTQSVTIQGVVTCIKGTYNGGTHYVQDATGGIQIFDSAAPTLAIGDEVSVTGTVSDFSGEIQLGTSIWNYVGSPGEPAPLVLTVLEALDNDGSGTQTAADYEIVGSLVQVTGKVAYIPGELAPPWTADNGQGLFGLHNDAGDTVLVFVDRTTGIDGSGIGENEVYQVTAPMSNFNGLLEMKPRQQSDLVENPGNPFPVVSSVTPDPWSPNTNQSVTVSADITDNGSIANATLYYEYGTAKVFTSVAMSNTGGNTYEATIPGTTQPLIRYYVEAEDDTGQITRVPGDAPASSRAVAVGLTSIVTIESNLQPGTDISTYDGQLVNVEGIVTVAPGELGSTSNYVIQQEGGGPWSGIFLYEGSGANVFFRGDKIRVSGTVSEFNGITELLPQSGDSIELLSINNPVPDFIGATSGELDTTEALESTLVKTFASAVCDTLFGGNEWWVATSTAPGDSCVYVDPGPAVTVTALPDQGMRVGGFLDTRFGRNEIVPRDDSDIELLAFTGNDPALPTRMAVMEQATPNPFNPSTSIKFSVPSKGITDLGVYNARGERIRTLVSGRLEAGDYTEVWNGLDDRGKPVSSGVYYARLRFETQRAQVQKLTLVK
jgi:DNA/RNA endonuclease YhcR with UshA esterase domain